MSLSSSKITDFLNRAQQINNHSSEAPKQSTTPMRRSKFSPSSLKKSSLSPISHQSFSSTQEDIPLPLAKNKLLSSTFNIKRQITLPQIPKFDTSPNPKDRGKFIVQPSTLDQHKSSRLTVKDVEAKSKKRIEKVIAIFKEEALKMDAKLQELQQENRRLREIYDNPQLASSKPIVKSVKNVLGVYLDSDGDSRTLQVLEDLCMSFRKCTGVVNPENILNWFECLRIGEEDYQGFLVAACHKIVQEQKRRLKTEEETGKMIELEESLIFELEEKVKNAERLARKASCGLIAEREEDKFRVAGFDRETVMKSLHMLLEKSNDG